MLPDSTQLARTLAASDVQGAEYAESALGLVCTVPGESVHATLSALAAAGYSMLVDITGADTGEGLELTYHLRSFAKDEEVFVRSGIPYDGAVRSAWDVYPAAIYTEREIAELLGMRFDGHPNPKRLFTTDRVEGWLLRKATPIRSHDETVRPGIPPHGGGGTDG